MTRPRILFVQHQPDCTPGHFGQRAEQQGLAVNLVDATAAASIDAADYDLIVPLGSDDSAYDETVPTLAAERGLLGRAVEQEVPVFGVCFGAQLLSSVLGGEVYRMPDGPEIGWLPVGSEQPQLITPDEWLLWHLDAMTPPPRGTEIARTARASQSFTWGSHMGVQFHPEASSWHVANWAQSYESELGALGIDPEHLLEETRRSESEARQRAYSLFDRVLHRAAAAVTR